LIKKEGHKVKENLMGVKNWQNFASDFVELTRIGQKSSKIARLCLS